MKKGRVKFFGIGLITAIVIFGTVVSLILVENANDRSIESTYAYQIGLLYSDGTSEIIETRVKIMGKVAPSIELSTDGCVYAINEKGETEIIACYVKRFVVFKVGRTGMLSQKSPKKKRRKKSINI